MTKYALSLAAAVAFFALPARAQTPVTSSAGWSEYEFEWVPGVASTTYGGAPDANARALYIHNRSTSATCYVCFDAQACTSTGGRGYKLAPDGEKSLDITGGFASRMYAACTAALSAGTALFTSWWK
jgi:hypothetical protein